MIPLAFAIGGIIGAVLVVPFVWRTRRRAGELNGDEARLTAALSWLAVLILFSSLWNRRR